MNWDELAALHAALAVVLAWPDSVRAEVARWLSPAAAKPGNGLDPHPPPIATLPEIRRPAPGKPRETGRRAPEIRRPGKPTPAQAAEQRLLEALQTTPGRA